MQIAIVAGGFTPGEADKLRRAMATFKRTGTIGTFKTKMIEGMVAQLCARLRRALLQPDRGLWRIRLSGKPRRELRAPRLCLGLAQVPLPGRLRAPRCSTRSRWASTRRRRSCATCASTASRCGRSTSIFRTGTARWSRARAPPEQLHALHRDMAGRYPHDPRAAAGFPQDQGPRREGCEADRRKAQRRLRLRARSLAAHGAAIERHRAAGRRRRLRLARPHPASGAVGRQGARPRRRPGRHLPLFRVDTDKSTCNLIATPLPTPPPQGGREQTTANGNTSVPHSEPDGHIAAHAARRGGRERLPLPRAVAARASGFVPAHRPHPARHRAQRGAAHAPLRRTRHRLRPRHHPPAAGLGQWASSS